MNDKPEATFVNPMNPAPGSSARYLLFPVWTLAIFGIGLLLQIAAPLFIWLVCSLMLMAFLDPWFLKMRRRGFSPVFSAVLLVLMAIIIIGLVLLTFISFSANIVTELQESKRVFAEYYAELVKLLKGMTDGLNHFSGAIPTKDAITGKAIPKVEIVEGSAFGGAMRETLVTSLGSVMTVFAYFCLWPILTFFLMAERDALGKAFAKGFPNAGHSSQLWHQMGSAIRAFFLGNLLLFLGTLPVFLLLFELFSIKSPMTVALLASLLNTVPFVGAVLTGALPVLMLLSESPNVGGAVWIYILCALIHFVVANFVTPKILGSKVNINATTATISIVAWSLLWGPIGLILGIPMTACLKIIFEHSKHPWLSWMAGLMSERIDSKVRLTLRRKPAAPST